jgi:DNA-directed RNA polymerase subunit M/transcription elongation factor TFIIS
MRQVIRKEICKCEKCGNEAEMVITCSLPDEAAAAPKPTAQESQAKPSSHKRMKATATCSHCGNEADIWIDF